MLFPSLSKVLDLQRYLNEQLLQAICGFLVKLASRETNYSYYEQYKVDDAAVAAVTHIAAFAAFAAVAAFATVVADASASMLNCYSRYKLHFSIIESHYVDKINSSL